MGSRSPSTTQHAHARARAARTMHPPPTAAILRFHHENRSFVATRRYRDSCAGGTEPRCPEPRICRSDVGIPLERRGLERIMNQFYGAITTYICRLCCLCVIRSQRSRCTIMYPVVHVPCGTVLETESRSGRCAPDGILIGSTSACACVQTGRGGGAVARTSLPAPLHHRSERLERLVSATVLPPSTLCSTIRYTVWPCTL